MKKIYVLFSLVVLFSQIVFAQNPQYNYTPNLITTNAFPLNSATNLRQNLYYPSDFNAPSGMITKIYIGAASSTSNPTYSPLTIKIGSTSLSTFTSGPFVSGLTTVFSQTATFPANSAAWLEINLQTPFYYDNTQNLIIEVSQGGYSNSFSAPCASSSAVPSTTNRTLYGTISGGTGTLQARLMKMGFDISPLSIDLLEFTAATKGEHAILNWITASEKDVVRFFIERSLNGIDFDAVGEVAAIGDENEKSGYSFIDKNAVRMGDVVYYRLKVMEKSGVFVLLKTMSVKFGSLQKSDLVVYPNPSDGLFNIEMNDARDSEYSITDLSGRIVSSGTSGEKKFPVDLTGFEDGIYFMRVRDEVIKLVKH